MESHSRTTKDFMDRILANTDQLRIDSNEREKIRQNSETSSVRLNDYQSPDMPGGPGNQHEEATPALESTTGPQITCPFWAKGTCTYGTNCKLAHHFFPVIVNRAHKYGDKTTACKVSTKGGKKTRECAWPAYQCGYLHQGEASAMVNTTDVSNRLEALPYEAICRWECKLCYQMFGSVEAAQEHCKAGGECPGIDIYGDAS